MGGDWVDVAYQASECPSRNKEMYVGIRVLEIEAQVLRESLDCCFGGIIRRITRRVSDSLLAPRNDDSTWSLRGSILERRHICVQTIDHAVQIGVEDLDFESICLFPMLARSSDSE